MCFILDGEESALNENHLAIREKDPPFAEFSSAFSARWA
jgi:hypothetical protein